MSKTVNLGLEVIDNPSDVTFKKFRESLAGDSTSLSLEQKSNMEIIDLEVATLKIKVEALSKAELVTIVNTLPTENISSKTIYLVPSENAKEGNTFVEYMYVNSTWEVIGTMVLDESSMNAILEVEALPTENIKTNILYKLTTNGKLYYSFNGSWVEVLNNTNVQEIESTYKIATSTDYDTTSDTEVPTTAAVQAIVDGVNGNSNISYVHLVELYFAQYEGWDYTLYIEMINTNPNSMTKDEIIAQLPSGKILCKGYFMEQGGTKVMTPYLIQIDNTTLYTIYWTTSSEINSTRVYKAWSSHNIKDVNVFTYVRGVE